MKPAGGSDLARGLLSAAVVIGSCALSPGAQALTALTGTVTSEEAGAALEGITVGVARASQGTGLDPDDPLPVEATAVTDGLGDYRFDLDETLPGMDTLHVFTYHHTVFNELYGAVDTRGMAPRRRDLDEPGVLAVDLTAGPASGVDFQVASSLSTQFVLMRDAVTTLGTDVWLPSRRAGLAWPVLLHRTPYPRGDPPRAFIDNDYAVVQQSTRGREDSGGTDEVFDDDGWRQNQDGYDTVEWVAQQPWCDGARICTFGASAPGITQYGLIGAVPPSLVCSVIEIAGGAPYHGMTFPGGEFRKHLVETWLGDQGSLHKLDEYFAHPNEDAYWQDRDLLPRAGLVRTPALHIGGWYDIFSQGTLDAFRTLQAAGGPGARRNQKLVIGPWVHGLYFSPFQGELVYPNQSLFADYADTVLRWYDFWLKGADTGIMDDPPARSYVMGPGLPEGASAPGNFWRTSDAWPPPAAATAYYLHPGGLLSTATPPTGGGETTYTSDPASPVPTLGGSNLYEDIGVGPFDQRSVDDVRADVVVWQTAPLGAPVEVSGPVRLVLHAASDRQDTDWAVKLEDVYPDGRAMLVTDLILKARHRVGHDREDLLTPGTIYTFDVELWDTSITFPAGHRIRVAVASSNFPRFEMNPQTGEPFNQETGTEVAVNRVQHNAANPSHLSLPVVDPAALTACRPAAAVAGLLVDKLAGGDLELSWMPSADPCHARYRIYAGLDDPRWPHIVRRPVAETTATTLATADAGTFWQVVSEGTDGGNGPHGPP